MVLIALFVTAYFARDLILPLILGFLLALTLSPLSRGMTRVGIPAILSAAILITSAAVGILLVAGGTAGTLALWSDELPRIISDIRHKMSGMNDAVEQVRSVTEEVEAIGDGPNKTQTVAVEQPGIVSSAFDTLTRVGATVAVTLILAMLLLASGDLFYRKLVQVFPTMTGKKRALSTVYAIERRVSHYLLTITVINAGLGVVIGTYLALLGMPNALVWGVLAFLLNFLPYIGGFFGALLVSVLAITEFDSVGYALLAPLGYLVITSIEGQLVTPWLVGRRLAMNTVAVFITVVFWGWLWGVPGALVAVPVLVVFKVICENFEPLKTIGFFLSGDEGPLNEAKGNDDSQPASASQ
nr:AI-2E family transporter [Sulfitobacter aestuariivivens]